MFVDVRSSSVTPVSLGNSITLGIQVFAHRVIYTSTKSGARRSPGKRFASRRTIECRGTAADSGLCATGLSSKQSSNSRTPTVGIRRRARPCSRRTGACGRGSGACCHRTRRGSLAGPSWRVPRRWSGDPTYQRSVSLGERSTGHRSRSREDPTASRGTQRGAAASPARTWRVRRPAGLARSADDPSENGFKGMRDCSRWSILVEALPTHRREGLAARVEHRHPRFHEQVALSKPPQAVSAPCSLTEVPSAGMNRQCCADDERSVDGEAPEQDTRAADSGCVRGYVRASLAATDGHVGESMSRP